MGWKRVGECPPEQCQGRCCQSLADWFPVDPDYQEFLKVRGLKVTEYGERFLRVTPQRCAQLTDDNLCALHPSMNPDPALPSRPRVCNEWPSHPSHLVNSPYCGFSFVEVQD